MRTLLFAIPLLAVCAPGHALRLYHVGVGEGCTHATLQSAIDAAASDLEPSEIRLSRTVAYANQSVRKTFAANDFELDIVGGYDTCLDPDPDGAHTVIDGSGGPPQSVLSFHGVAEIDISRVTITGGDAEDDEYGGAIYFGAEGRISLYRVSLADNRAGYGGAIAVDHPKAFLRVWSDVMIHDNFARYQGGGLHCRGATVRLVDSGSGFLFNRTHDSGGGAYLRDCTADFASAGPFDAGVFLGNQSTDGGALTAYDSTVDIYTRDPSHPTRVSFNSSHDGGAFYVRNHGKVRLFDVIVEGNRGLRGGVAHLYSDAEASAPSMIATTARPGSRHAPPAAALPCAPNLTCNRFTGNRADVNGSGPGDGAIWYSAYDVPWYCSLGMCFWPLGSSAAPDIEFAFIDRNLGHNLFRISKYADRFAVAQSIVVHNSVRDTLIHATSDDTVVLSQSTVSHNAVAGPLVRSKGLDVRCSILAQAQTAHSGASVASDFVMVPDGSVLPPSVTTLVAVPRFVSPPRDDFRLVVGSRGQPSSPGVDFARPECGPVQSTFDFLGRNRPVDLPSVGNRFGALDLGAIEGTAPVVVDPL
jgi:hypothetical protein